MGTIGSIYRVGGLVSGLDTDSLVKQLMQAERLPLEKLNQNKQILEWKKENFREITNLLRGFKDEFFNVLKPQANMSSSTPYKKFTVSTSNSTNINATAQSTAMAGTHDISVTQFAKAASTVSSEAVTKPLEGTAAALTDFSSGNNSLDVTLDGVTKTVSLQAINYTATYGAGTDFDQMVTDLQTSIDTAFGNGKVTVSQAGGVIKFNAPTNKVTISNASTNNALASLQFTTGVTNRISTSETLETLASKLGQTLTFDVDDQVKFTINDVDFEIDKTATLSELMNEINSSAAGVTLSYSEANDKFTLTSKTKGAGENITISNTGGNLFDAVAANSALKIATGSASNGQDAVFTLDLVAMKRNDNTFTIDGVTYKLVDTGGAGPWTATIDLTLDVDGIYDNIKSFVDKYNETIEKINGELTEKRSKEYLPLSSEQKEAMSEEDIKLWEAKAKSGLLKNDGILQKIVVDIRKALFDEIDGVSGTLSEIGITTGDYREKGKLIIDEDKLKNAIQANPDKIENLFSKTSSTSYSADLTTAQRAQRYSEEGIAQRIYDVLQDHIRTIRDGNGKKGFLLEKAGIVGDVTEFRNILDSDIDGVEDDISTLIERLKRKEDAYYRKFTALEKAMSMLNNQSDWLAQQFGGQS